MSSSAGTKTSPGRAMRVAQSLAPPRRSGKKKSDFCAVGFLYRSRLDGTKDTLLNKAGRGCKSPAPKGIFGPSCLERHAAKCGEKVLIKIE